MSDDPQNPYPYGSQPEGEGSEPGWGSAGEEPTYPQYQQYQAPQVPPAPAQGYPPAPGGYYPQQLGGYPPPYGSQPGYPPMPYGFGGPGWGVDAFGRPYSDKTKATAGLLQLLLPFLSVCGVGRLYAGHTGIGLVQLLGFYLSICGLGWIGIGFLIGGGIWLWTVIDGIVILSSESRDGQRRLLR